MDKRILIVDDEPDILEVVSAIIKHQGHEVVTAGSGEAALDILAKRSFDLVMTDLMMPGITGWQLLEKIKAKTPNTLVVVFTGYIDDQGESILTDRKADGFLTKPLDIPKLQALLESLLVEEEVIGASAVIVDDLQVTINMVTRILEGVGIAVHGFLSPPEALAHALRDPPHVFLIDLEMPEVSGFELCEKIRETDQVNHIPIIIVTSHSDRDTVLRAMQLGVQGFVVKPYDPDALIDKVKTAIAGARRT